MALVLLCGQPCSGKSTAAECLRRALESQGPSSSCNVRTIDEPSLHLDRNQSYADMPSEKNLRGVLRSEVDRSVSKDSFVIVDSLNNIKGYRYELWCLARAAGIRYCVLYCDVEESYCKAWNMARQERGEPAYNDKIVDDLVRRFEKPERRNRWDSPLFELKPSEDIWWRSYGARAPNLQKLAIRILSQTCSSSGCERNWSVFEKIHAKKRNRLEFARLNDLVYVHYNIRLQVRQIESPMDPDAISVDNIDVLSPWRVESEEPILEESPSWLEPVADDPLEQGQQEEDSKSEEQQHLEEEQEEQEEEDTAGASTSTPSAIDIGEHSSIPSTHYLTLGAEAGSGPSTTRGRPGKQPIMFSRKRGRGQ